MPRFNNGMPGRNGGGFGMGNGSGNGMERGMGGGMGAGQGRGAGGGRGRGVNCRGRGPGFVVGDGSATGQASAPQRNPGFFRRFCLGLTDQSAPESSTVADSAQSVIADLQRQIDALKKSTDK